MNKKVLFIVVSLVLGTIPFAVGLPIYAGNLSRGYFHETTEAINASLGPGFTYDVAHYKKGFLSSESTTVLKIDDGDKGIEVVLDHLIKHSYGNIVGRSVTVHSQIAWDASSSEIAQMVDTVPALRQIQNVMTVDADGSLLSTLSIPAITYTEDGETASFDGMSVAVEYVNEEVPAFLGSVALDKISLDTMSGMASLGGGKGTFRYYEHPSGLFVGSADMVLNDLLLESPASPNPVKIGLLHYLADQSIADGVVKGGFEMKTMGLHAPYPLQFMFSGAFKDIPVDPLVKIQEISKSKNVDDLNKLFSEGIIQEIIDSDAHMVFTISLKNDDGEFSADAQFNLSGDLGVVNTVDEFAANPLQLLSLPRVDARAYIHKDLLVRAILASMNGGAYPSDQDVISQQYNALQMIEPVLGQGLLSYDEQQGVFRSSFSYANGAGTVNGKRLF